MKDNLAELLLAKVMGWEEDDVTSERPDLQAIGAYKYDEYQQFSPGMRFIESLAIWLRQFKTINERRIAYHFVKNRMIFISGAEMAHLVITAYPDLIRPIILKKAAIAARIPEYMLTKITQSTPFKALRRQSLFLGLSDGAHTDTFRRSKPPKYGMNKYIRPMKYRIRVQMICSRNLRKISNGSFRESQCRKRFGSR